MKFFIFQILFSHLHFKAKFHFKLDYEWTYITFFKIFVRGQRMAHVLHASLPLPMWNTASKCIQQLRSTKIHTQ